MWTKLISNIIMIQLVSIIIQISNNNHIFLQRMDCIFCAKNTCLVNEYYHFLRGILIDKLKSSNMDPHSQVINIVHRKCSWKQAWASKLFPHPMFCNRIDTLSCFQQKWKIYWILVCRWWMINQLDACKLEDEKAFHIHVELLDENTKWLIEKSPNHSVWEISISENWV